MRNRVVLTGVTGRLTWGFYPAARVGAFTLLRDETTKVVTLTGRLTDLDPFRLTQAPIAFETPVGATVWKWTCLTLTVIDAHVRATLGERESMPCIGSSAPTSVH